MNDAAFFVFAAALAVLLLFGMKLWDRLHSNTPK
jgi:hypothetical protein